MISNFDNQETMMMVAAFVEEHSIDNKFARILRNINHHSAADPQKRSFVLSLSPL